MQALKAKNDIVRKFRNLFIVLRNATFKYNLGGSIVANLHVCNFRGLGFVAFPLRIGMITCGGKIGLERHSITDDSGF